MCPMYPRLLSRSLVVVISMLVLAGPAMTQYTYNGMSKKDYFSGQWMQIGSEAEKRGNYQEAIADYRKALEYDPKLAIAYVSIGYCYDQMHRYDDLIPPMQTALKVTKLPKEL